MSNFNPSQVSFAGGEISPRARGRVDSELYRKALAFCENWQLMPLGSAMRRAGSRQVAIWPEVDEPRLFAFPRLGETDDVVVAISTEVARIYDRTTGAVSFGYTLISNGHFDDSSDWTFEGHAASPSGAMNLYLRNVPEDDYDRGFQVVTTVIGHDYRLTYRAQLSGNDAINLALWVRIGTAYAGHVHLTQAATWVDFTVDFTADDTSTEVAFSLETDKESPYLVVRYLQVDDVGLVDLDAAPNNSIAVPFTTPQLDDIQFSADRSKNRGIFVHPEVQPSVVRNDPATVWDVEPAVFTGQPPTWGGANWPSVIEFGFQGRTWWAATPDDPNRLWGSKSGYPFDFTVGTDPDDPIDVLISTKGGIQWLQGHRVLLAGSEMGEHGITGSSRIIAPGDIQVTDESAFGGADVQAAHIGDQVVWVDPPRRHVRAMAYSLEGGGWTSRSLTFAAEHITEGEIRELHWAKSPVPTLVLLLQTGDIVACTYDRAEQVIAWWRIDLGEPVRSCCVANSENGAELWASLTRNGVICIERIPLHEASVTHLDSSTTGAVPAGGVITGLTHLEGQTVSIVVDGCLLEDQVVASGTVTVDAALEAKLYSVGLPFVATMTQLPLEGGLAGGSSQAARRRRTKVRLRLNDSAMPTVNGYRPAERAPADPMDTPTDLVTGDVDVQVLGWEEDGALTIAQDLPFRTEVLAVFGDAVAND